MDKDDVISIVGFIFAILLLVLLFLWCVDDPIWDHPTQGGGKLYYFQNLIAGMLAFFAGAFVLISTKFSDLKHEGRMKKYTVSYCVTIKKRSEGWLISLKEIDDLSELRSLAFHIKSALQSDLDHGVFSYLDESRIENLIYIADSIKSLRNYCDDVIIKIDESIAFQGVAVPLGKTIYEMEDFVPFLKLYLESLVQRSVSVMS